MFPVRRVLSLLHRRAPCHMLGRRGRRVGLKTVALAAVAFATSLVAQTPVQPAVQPGGDIPPSSHSVPAAPAFAPRLSLPVIDPSFQYERRQVWIAMRDGARLYAVLIIPKTSGKHPIMLDRTPYSADKKVSVPINPMVDGWKGDDWFHKGAFRQEMVGYVFGQTSGRTSVNEWFPSITDDYAAALRVGSAAAYGHALGLDRLPFWQRLIRHPAYDSYWQEQALDGILAQHPLTVPTLIVGSEWDQEDIYGAPALFNAVKASPDAHLVLGPWYHGQANFPGVTLGPMNW